MEKDHRGPTTATFDIVDTRAVDIDKLARQPGAILILAQMIILDRIKLLARHTGWRVD